MTGDHLQIRPAVPNERDAEAFSYLMEEATHGLMHDMFGSAAPRFLAKVFIESRHDLSYEHVLFAETDGEIAGMASAFTTATFSRDAKRTRSVTSSAAGIRGVRAGAVALLGRSMFSFMDAHEHGDTYLQAIAVDSAKRGAGIGSVLLDAVREQAVKSGSRRLALDVDVENQRAVDLYERVGWKVVGTSKPTSRWFGRSQVHRMMLTLS